MIYSATLPPLLAYLDRLAASSVYSTAQTIARCRAELPAALHSARVFDTVLRLAAKATTRNPHLTPNSRRAKMGASGLWRHSSRCRTTAAMPGDSCHRATPARNTGTGGREGTRWEVVLKTSISMNPRGGKNGAAHDHDTNLHSELGATSRKVLQPHALEAMPGAYGGRRE